MLLELVDFDDTYDEIRKPLGKNQHWIKSRNLKCYYNDIVTTSMIQFTRYVIVERMLLSRLNTSFCNALTTCNYRSSLFDNLRQNGISILPFSDSYLIKILLFGSNEFNLTSNKTILSSVINFIIQSKRFDGPLFLKKSMLQTLETICFFLYFMCRVVLLSLSLRYLARVLLPVIRCFVVCCSVSCLYPRISLF